MDVEGARDPADGSALGEELERQGLLIGAQLRRPTEGHSTLARWSKKVSRWGGCMSPRSLS
ncbi:hypothetical protein [uncultured Jannaschia sp.]|uniref:hypothetical protein n=1 Tax=uncultured Jannaschia sp. TaxID=293347 RepID=UPI00261F1689|nr:hypothetical protein [uncultured Jannaschia sp.]